ncbi:integrase arm-type DNA-binding domain-containing protein [Sphingopyxis sp. KK2]|uniref:tyrosine-type recombinase/integrase n=1 Tax=Sphingopyxis sp. KK2 TaxID=1855727 RepID=UPI00097E5943|nr:integrase arm-type DNA-binding domain-containing protein [Sphingopyxis sp. KK2]
MALKELEVKYATKRQRPYKLSDGEGLHLLVQPSGAKLWRLKYRFDGKEKLLSFGKYPVVTLAIAREKRWEAKRLLDQGKDPAEAKKQAKRQRAALKLFEEIARAWHRNRAEGLDPAHAKRVINRMERDVFPVIGKRPIAEIDAPEILEMIRAVEARGALDVSRRLKQGVSQVFRFAIASGWATVDPTLGLNDALRPKPPVRHMARVPLAEFPTLVRAILAYDGEETPRRSDITRDALMFTLLTWARTSETRFARWDEFENLDGEQPLWRLSCERMKMEREHLVPLSCQAVELLRRRRRETNSDFVFPGAKQEKPISENTMIYACYRMGYRRRQTVHGFRGLASTWANEAECYKPDWIEMALAHEDEDEVRGAYNSALYLTPRRRMLQDWANMIDEIARPPSVGDRVARAEPPRSTSPHRVEPEPQRLLPETRDAFWRRPRRPVLITATDIRD